MPTYIIVSYLKSALLLYFNEERIQEYDNLYYVVANPAEYALIRIKYSTEPLAFADETACSRHCIYISGSKYTFFEELSVYNELCEHINECNK